eukprot:TRINITY_DN28220_c0_g1_i1.p1 TRINITY_DN28220_c0_g1~~TRINITY_DN28220_c0_g1_i1.p1  ORF type:complete len:233 (+),score=39.11 TRINITY_DN28220_c0_g1_i1:102-701(+)
MQKICATAVAPHVLAPKDVLFQENQHAHLMFFFSDGRALYEVELHEDSDDESCSDDESETGGSSDGLSESSDTLQVELESGDWLAEPVLWVEWNYMGSVSSVSKCDLVALDSVKFREAVLSSPQASAEACLYAKNYVDGLNQAKGQHYTDLHKCDFDKTLEKLSVEFSIDLRPKGARASLFKRFSLASVHFKSGRNSLT